MTQYIKDNKIATAEDIVIVKDGFQIINPSEKQILEDGWIVYIPIPYVPPIKLSPDEYEIEAAIMLRIRKKQQAAIIAEVEKLSDEEALEVKVLCETWASYVGKAVKVGKRLYYNDKLYKVRQNHVAQEHQPPSQDTAALYEEICEKASGTVDDPIPYNNNMRLELGKYYIQDGIVYKCTRDSQVAVYNPLAELVGIYVE